MTPVYGAVALVDVLGAQQAFGNISDIKSLITITNELLTTTNTLLTDSKTILGELKTNSDTANTLLGEIKDGLSHVKVDSYVNVRVVDEFGLAPVPCTEITGLLVSAFAGPGGPPAVSIVNPYLNVVINNSAGTAAIPSDDTFGLKIFGEVEVSSIVPITGAVSITNTPLPVTGETTITGPVDARIHMRDCFTSSLPWRPVFGTFADHYVRRGEDGADHTSYPFEGTAPCTVLIGNGGQYTGSDWIFNEVTTAVHTNGPLPTEIAIRAIQIDTP